MLKIRLIERMNFEIGYSWELKLIDDFLPSEKVPENLEISQELVEIPASNLKEKSKPLEVYHLISFKVQKFKLWAY